MATRKVRENRTRLVLCALVLAGCTVGHPAASSRTAVSNQPAASGDTAASLGPLVTVASTSVPTTTAVATTAAPTTSASPAPVGPPLPIVASTTVLVDRSRPTISDGVTVAPSRTLITLIWAPRAKGRWPLLVFGHGFEVGPTPYVTLLEAWAEQGYVVAAPEFPLTDAAIAGPHLDENDIQQQPADMRFVIDSLVRSTSAYSPEIDPDRVAIAGHSDGAETALALGDQPTPAGEPEIRAVIAMSVSPLLNVTHTSTPPLLVTQGDADTINLPSKGIQAWDEAASPKYLAILHGAGHLPPLETGSPWLAVIEATTDAFLRTYLAGSGTVKEIMSAGTAPPLVTITSG